MALQYNYMNCVVCDEPAGYDHKCSVEKINRIEGGRKSWEDRDPPAPLYGHRLYDGFTAMKGDSNGA